MAAEVAARLVRTARRISMRSRSSHFSVVTPKCSANQKVAELRTGQYPSTPGVRRSSRPDSWLAFPAGSASVAHRFCHEITASQRRRNQMVGVRGID